MSLSTLEKGLDIEAMSIAARRMALTALCLAAGGLWGVPVAPQDGNYAVVSSIPLRFGDGAAFINPTVHDGLVYYSFVDGLNSRKGIRARDTGGNLVHEILLPGFSGHEVGHFAFGPDGTLYAIQGSPDNFLVHTYTLSEGSYVETGTIGIEGTDSSPFVESFPTDGRLAVSPVSGRVFVKEDRSISNDPQYNGEVRVYDATGFYIGDIQINGILSPEQEGNVVDMHAVAGTDGSGELWVRGNYGSGAGTTSQWYKVFDEDGTFLRLFDVGDLTRPHIDGEFMYLHPTGDWTYMIPLSAESVADRVGWLYKAPFKDDFEGRDNRGRIIDVTPTRIDIYAQPVFRTFAPSEGNAIPDARVTAIRQRQGTTLLDIAYRVDDADDASVTTAVIALEDGVQSVRNIIPVATLVEGTSANLGAGMATNSRHSLVWDAGADWGVEIGNLSVMVLARDSRANVFDVHMVSLPQDGNLFWDMTISRNPLEEYDFTMQWFWLVATSDPAISLVDGIIYGSGGEIEGVPFTDSFGNSTTEGRDFLLARDGLREAGELEVRRARDAATPDFVIQMDPPAVIRKVNPDAVSRNLPVQVNEYGIESFDGVSGPYDYSENSTNLWYVVPRDIP